MSTTVSESERIKLRSKDDVIAYVTGLEGITYYAPVLARLKEESLTIRCGNDAWNPEWYTPFAWENRSWPFVLEMLRCVPAATNYELSYDPSNDYHHIKFDLEGVRYDLQWYKIYHVYRESDRGGRLFNRSEFAVVEFFQFGKFRDPKQWLVW